MRLHATFALVVGGLIYGLFALACFRLAVIHHDEVAVSVGEGLFTVLGAAALFVAVVRQHERAVIVVLGTVPLVGWFVATPWNSGPPFLAASLIAPFVAIGAWVRGRVTLRMRS